MSIIHSYRQLMVPVYGPKICLTSGSGTKVWDDGGRQYIDLTAGIAVLSLGHCHPKLVDILINQAKKLWHTSNHFLNEPNVHFAQLLTENTFAEQVFFANSGAEANEAALKLARKYAVDNISEDKNEIIAFNNSFHGRTLFAVTVGGNQKYKQGFSPLPLGITHVNYNDIEAVKRSISAKTCGVILEPVQGEGGIIVPDADFLSSLRNLCNQHQALLIFDEVQTGVGRTGYLYNYMQHEVVPDILTTAKALGNGMPISAMLTTAKIAASFQVGTHGTTYGGNPLACAVATEVLNIIKNKDFLQQVRDKGNYLVDKLAKLNDKHSVFKDIRGTGLMIGAQLEDKFSAQGKLFMQCAEAAGVLVLLAGGGKVIRIVPPLNISHADIDAAIDKLNLAIGKFLAAAVKIRGCKIIV